jgi:hypothetical protein
VIRLVVFPQKTAKRKIAFPETVDHLLQVVADLSLILGLAGGSPQLIDFTIWQNFSPRSW